MTITAPFRFARINRKVWFPNWAPLVSHDVPFADGLCGTITLTITTKTPLLVGGKHTKEAEGQPGTVHPFVDGNGKWAIPGSGIQGVIRQILEVAAFGKLGPLVHDRRFGVRDISDGPTANAVYRGRLVNKVQTGWLIRTADGACLQTCGYDRISISELIRRKAEARNTLQGRNDAGTRLRKWTAANNGSDLSLLETNWDGKPATIVLTGKTSEGIDRRRDKKAEFVFFGPSRTQISVENAALNSKLIDDDVWRDFLLIHDPENGSGGTKNPNWAFWEGEFKAGRPVPVFFIEEGGRVSALGMAQMFKLAMELSTHEMLEHSSPDHIDRERFDLPSLIFGATGGEGAKDSWYEHNLKRRAAFDLFRAVDPPADCVANERRDDWQVLLSPKPSYYPIYVRQVRQPDDHRPYAAYHRMNRQTDLSLKRPELSGAKIWPVRGSAQPQANQAIKYDIRRVANHLRSVPEGQRFSGGLRVHNLRPVELGALLWALSYGEEGKYTHHLGGAKPLGFGEVSIAIEGMELIPNDPNQNATPDKAALIKAFTDEMEKFYGNNWAKSPQVQALRKAAEVGTGGLSYLAGHIGYKNAREANEILPAYVDEAAELRRSEPANAPAPMGGGGALAAGRPAARTWPKAEEAPVRHNDGREGLIREVMRGACRVSVGGILELWQESQFTVTGPPEDE